MTLHYDFPHITCLSDVLPAIEGCPEFVVVKKDTGITVVNYVMVGKDTFPEAFCFTEAASYGDTDRYSAIRRECRGLIFDTDSGALIARRLHKFFNLGEREDTTVIDISKPHCILEKLDGSMVTPFPVLMGGLRWGTKMGITNVSMQAESFVSEHPDYTKMAEDLFASGLTCIFEWCSNKQRIVVDQPEDRLVLLHIRDTITGRYLPRLVVEKIGSIYEIPVVEALPLFVGAPWDMVVETVKAQEGAEGVVICFEDGHMVKVKSDWYVNLHRVKASIEKERDVARLILTDKTDDLIPLLSDEDKVRLIDYGAGVLLDINNFAKEVRADLRYATIFDTSRKEYAEHTASVLPALRACVFHMWDHKEDEDIWPQILEWSRTYIVRNSLSNNSFQQRAKQVLSTARWEERTY